MLKLKIKSWMLHQRLTVSKPRKETIKVTSFLQLHILCSIFTRHLQNTRQLKKEKSDKWSKLYMGTLQLWAGLLKASKYEQRQFFHSPWRLLGGRGWSWVKLEFTVWILSFQAFWHLPNIPQLSTKPAFPLSCCISGSHGPLELTGPLLPFTASWLG